MAPAVVQDIVNLASIIILQTIWNYSKLLVNIYQLTHLNSQRQQTFYIVE